MKTLLEVILRIKDYSFKTVVTASVIFSGGIVLAIGPYQIPYNNLNFLASLFGIILAIGMLRIKDEEEFINVLSYLFFSVIFAFASILIIEGVPMSVFMLNIAVTILVDAFVVFLLSKIKPPKRRIGF